jgi:hypothetical protein
MPKHPYHNRIQTAGPWLGLSHEILLFSKMVRMILIKVHQFVVFIFPNEPALKHISHKITD